MVISTGPVATSPTQLTSLIFGELAEIGIKDKEFDKAKNSLKKNYNLRKLGNLQRKYIKKPQQFKEKLREFGERFAEDYEKFRETYASLFTDIDRTVNVAGRTLTEDLHQVDELVKRIEQGVAAHPEMFFFPKEAIQKFREEFKKAINALAAQLKIEYAEYLGASRGRRVKIGFFSKMIGNRAAARTGRRKAKKLAEQAEMMQEISREILQELNTGIRQDFIALLLHYVMALEKTDESLKQIKKDLVIIMDNVTDEVRGVIQAIAKFIVVMENDPVIGPRIKAARDNFHNEQGKVVNLLRDTTKWPRFERTIAIDLTAQESRLISALTGINERHIAGAAQRIVNQEMKF